LWLRHLVPFSQSSLAILTQALQIFLYAIHTIVLTFKCQDRNAIIDNKWKYVLVLTLPLNVLFLGLQFGKNLGFSQMSIGNEVPYWQSSLAVLMQVLETFVYVMHTI
jgi:hypothetical protein